MKPLISSPWSRQPLTTPAKLTRIFTPIIAALAGFSLQMAPASAQQNPVVVELFTSQSCSSCVPATHVFNDLATRDDLVVLSWHVDYWNDLQTREGRWKDPYSSAAYTERQRVYNQDIRGRASVYTPQAVIAGSAETVGSSRAKIERMIEDQRITPTNAITTQANANQKIGIGIDPSDINVDAYLIRLVREAQTDVRGGENAGVDFYERNIVASMKHLGTVRREARSFVVNAPAQSETCAIIVENPRTGRIVSAQYCP